jgi:lysine 2,3-aminomutase
MAINNLKPLPLRITHPIFASLIYNTKPSHPLRRNVVPVVEELITTRSEQSDPLHEKAFSPVKGIVNRYPDRVLFTVTQVCSNYCRYCTRSHSVGRLDKLGRQDFEKAFNYIASHKHPKDFYKGEIPSLTDEENRLYLLNIRR